MAGCSVCGDEESFLHSCNRCGKKNCPEHQLPENHVCVPSKTEISDDGESSTKWFDEKYDRTNVMDDESRGEREMVDDPDSHLEETETKRPLDDDEIDADTDSSPHDWVRDVQKNRESLKDKTTDRRKSSESGDADTSSYPHDAESERRKNRERMNRRLSSNDSTSSDYDPSASTPPSPRSGSSTDSNTSTPSRIPSALWIVALLVLVVAVYLLIGTV